MNVRQISKVSLSPEVVDCIVFWTKNPRNILPKLGLLKDYMYYFQFTLTPYDSKIERNLPSKDILIDTFKELSDKIGPERVIWRYDPIIMSNELNPQYHAGRFGDLASKLHRHTKTCIISFVDFYAKARKNLKTIDAKNASEHDIKSIALKLSYIAKNYSLKLETCAEDIELEQYGIGHSKCIDPNLIESLLDSKIKADKDKNQRQACGCVTSIDIGAYNTCLHDCVYCYANYSKDMVKKNTADYNVDSPLLCSQLTSEDKIREREMKSFIIGSNEARSSTQGWRLHKC